MIVMVMKIGASGYQSVSEYLNNRYRSIRKAQYRLRYDTDPIIGGTLVFTWWIWLLNSLHEDLFVAELLQIELLVAELSSV